MKGPWRDLDYGDLAILDEVVPGYVAAQLPRTPSADILGHADWLGVYYGDQSACRNLLEVWWRQVTGHRRPPCLAAVGTDEWPARRRELHAWRLERGYGILEGRPAPVFAVYALAVREHEGRNVSVELRGLAARLLLAGDVRELRGR